MAISSEATVAGVSGRRHALERSSRERIGATSAFTGPRGGGGGRVGLSDRPDEPGRAEPSSPPRRFRRPWDFPWFRRVCEREPGTSTRACTRRWRGRPETTNTHIESITKKLRSTLPHQKVVSRSHERRESPVCTLTRFSEAAAALRFLSPDDTRFALGVRLVSTSSPSRGPPDLAVGPL